LKISCLYIHHIDFLMIDSVVIRYGNNVAKSPTYLLIFLLPIN